MRRSLRQIFFLLLAGQGIFLVGCTGFLALGWDPLVTFLLTIPAFPILVASFVLALLPWLDVRPGLRLVGVGLPFLLLVTNVPFWRNWTSPIGNWPFRASFFLHRSALDAYAREIRVAASPVEPRRIGILDFIDIQFIDPEAPEESNLGLQLTGGGGGGVHLVQAVSDSDFVWWNTNWEFDLGGDWFLVYQD